MTKSELIELVARKHNEINTQDVETVVNTIISELSDALAQGERVEIRGFGAFSVVDTKKN
jgi:integration host factor subunit beta